MACSHGIGPTSRDVVFRAFKCGGTKRGCGRHAWPPGGSGPTDPCPNCGTAFAADGDVTISIGYCSSCFPQGLPRQFLPSFVPVDVVGGNPPAL